MTLIHVEIVILKMKFILFATMLVFVSVMTSTYPDVEGLAIGKLLIHFIAKKNIQVLLDVITYLFHR